MFFSVILIKKMIQVCLRHTIIVMDYFDCTKSKYGLADKLRGMSNCRKNVLSLKYCIQTE